MPMMLTASGGERADQCPVFPILPHVRVTTEWSSRGTEVHAFLEKARDPSVGPVLALADVADPWRALCAAIDLEALPPGIFAAEVAFALNVETMQVQELGRGIHRNYPDLGPGWTYGTADIIGLAPDAVFVGDYKTGYKAVPHPLRNRQLRWLGLAAALLYGRELVIVEIVYIREDGTPVRQRAEYDAFELSVIADEVRERHRRVMLQDAKRRAGDPLDYHVGPWCDLCPAWLHCEPKTAMIRIAAGEPLATLQQTPLRSTTAAALWPKVLEAERVITRLKADIKELAGQAPIYLSGSTWLGWHETEGDEKIDGAIGYHVLKEELGEPAARSAVKYTLTKKALKDAVRQWKKPTEKIAHVERRILERIGLRGGLSRSGGRQIGEYGDAPPAALTDGGTP